MQWLDLLRLPRDDLTQLHIGWIKRAMSTSRLKSILASYCLLDVHAFTGLLCKLMINGPTSPLSILVGRGMPDGEEPRHVVNEVFHFVAPSAQFVQVRLFNPFMVFLWLLREGTIADKAGDGPRSCSASEAIDSLKTKLCLHLAPKTMSLPFFVL